MEELNRAKREARPPLKQIAYLFLLYKAEKPSVCPSVRLSALFGTLITQPWQHVLKRDLLEMKAVYLRITKFIFKSRHVRLLIHKSALKALV